MLENIGPPSLDSEYDEYLGIPDIDDCSNLSPYTITDASNNCGEGDLPIGRLTLIIKGAYSLWQWDKQKMQNPPMLQQLTKGSLRK